MTKITRMEIMRLTSIKDVVGNDYHEDWRIECIGGQGLVLFEELVRKFISRESLKFYCTKDGVFIDELQTSYGFVIEENEEKIVFQTRNSIYTFEFENTLPDDTKDAMLRFGKEEKEKFEFK